MVTRVDAGGKGLEEMKKERERERERENNKWLHAGSEVNSRTNFHLRIPQEKCGVFLLISILAIKGLSVLKFSW